MSYLAATSLHIFCADVREMRERTVSLDVLSTGAAQAG